MIKQVVTDKIETVKKYVVLPRISETRNLVRTRTEEVNTPEAPENYRYDVLFGNAYLVYYFLPPLQLECIWLATY